MVPVGLALNCSAVRLCYSVGIELARNAIALIDAFNAGKAPGSRVAMVS
jgi:hypothetical protein